MTRPKPTIAEAYASHRANFILRTPFGVLDDLETRALIRCTARDAGVTVEAVKAEVGNG